MKFIIKQTLSQYAECFLHVFTVLYYHSSVSVDIVKLVSDYKIIEAFTGRGVVTETAHGWRCLCVMVGPSVISFHGAQHPWWRPCKRLINQNISTHKYHVSVVHISVKNTNIE